MSDPLHQHIGMDLRALSDDAMLRARLSEIADIPQGAMNSLNPVTRIGAQMVDAIHAHDKKAFKKASERGDTAS